MVPICLIILQIGFATSFRGPHHPRSSVSHHHYAPQKDVKLTQDIELLHDTTHLKEDMGPIADQLDLSKMSEQELEFYYFKVHDVDNNTKLDGLEILHAIQHTLHEYDGEGAEYHTYKNAIPSKPDDYEDQLLWIIEVIDKVLKEDDLDNDGYLSYMEYVIGKQRAQNEKSDKDLTQNTRMNSK